MPCRITLIARAELTISADCNLNGAQDYIDNQLFEHRGRPDCNWKISNVEIIEVQRNGSDEER